MYNRCPLGVDVNAKIQYQDLLWLGFSYRYNQGYAAMLGVNISSTINLGYSYDYTTTQLNTVSNGTHEIVLGFLWRKNNKNNSKNKFIESTKELITKNIIYMRYFLTRLTHQIRILLRSARSLSLMILLFISLLTRYIYRRS